MNSDPMEEHKFRSNSRSSHPSQREMVQAELKELLAWIECAGALNSSRNYSR